MQYCYASKGGISLKINSNFTGSNLIANGETSKIFYFNTRPSSPPSELKCNELSENKLEFVWNEPIIKSSELSQITYEYQLVPENSTVEFIGK